MSTKIYEGRRVHLSPNIADILWFSNEIRAVIAPVRKQLFNKLLPNGETARKAREAYQKDPGLLATLDFGAELVWYPCSKRVQLLTPFFHLKEYYKALDGMKNVTEYWYWDNADLPEGMSARAWRKRKLDWEKALTGRTGIPSHEGLTITLFPPGIPYTFEL